MKTIVILFCMCMSAFAGHTQAFVKSATDDFDWRVTGRVLMDAGFFHSDSTRLGNGVVMGDVRLGALMHFLQDWTGKIEVGYAYNKVALKDTYIAYKKGDHSWKAGYYFEPFGTEIQVATTAYRLMNMSTTSTAFGDKRKLGATYTCNRKYFTVVGGIFGDTDLENSKNIDGGYTLTAQLIGRPVYDEEKVVHLGFSARFSEPDKEKKEKLIYKAGAPSYVLNKEKNTFLRAEVTHALNQWRMGADIILLYKSFYFQSEYLMAHVNRFGSRNYTGKGLYSQIGFLLGGDRKYKYSRANGWVSNPDPNNLELLLRYNITDLNDKKAGICGGQAQDVTLGVNYFFNKYVVAKLNYTYMFTDRYAVNGKENIDYIQARLQLRF